MASSSDVPSPSVTELMTKMSNALCTDSTSGRKPASRTCFSRWRCDLVLERRPQLALAGDDEARVGHLADDQRGGLDRVALALVRHQRGDVADDRRAVRQPEFLVQLAARGAAAT